MDKRAFLVAVGVGWLACLAGSGRGYPLYAATDPPHNAEEVSQLAGYVKAVDGKEVTEHGGSFELLPGCHTVVTPSEWGSVGSSGGIIVKTGHATFLLPMKAARQYLVEVQATRVGGASAITRLVALEKDMQGNVTKVFGPAKSDEDIAACRAADNP